MERDRIDFGTADIGKLFRKILIPTLLGMVFSAMITITDGIFVGRGLGSDSLAAVNIVAPFFLLTAGVGLMFGVGASVVASIHLSKNKMKAARINITQALLVSSVIMLIGSALVMSFRIPVAWILGSSERLLPFVLEYMDNIVPFLVFNMSLHVGMFIIRLDGSPKFAMWCNAIPAAVNIVLDYVFIFIFGWGLAGAAWASVIGVAVGSVMIYIYLWRHAIVLHLYRLKLSVKSLKLTLRNTAYMVRIGSSALLSEGAIAFMMLVGNYVFIRMLGEDGVAAFSVACYCFPIAFMINNAIAQSAQPIISYNYGVGDSIRVYNALKLAVVSAIGSGILGCLIFVFGSPLLVSLFLDSSSEAYRIAVQGMPWFGVGFLFFGLNICMIGYYQSIENARQSILFTLLRGYLVIGITFQLLPKVWGATGIWLAVPVAELVTLLVILLYYFSKRQEISLQLKNR